MHAAILAATVLFAGQNDFNAGEFKLPPISTEPGNTSGEFTIPPASPAKEGGDTSGEFNIPAVDFGPTTTTPAKTAGELNIPDASAPANGRLLLGDDLKTPPRADFSASGPLSGRPSSPDFNNPPPAGNLQTVNPTQPIGNTTEPLNVLPPTSSRTLTVAEQLINRFFDQSAAATVNDLRLQDVVQSAADPTVRLKNVQAYWTLAAAKADAAFARNELVSLERLQRASNELDRAILEAARSAAKARVVEADLALSAARHAIPLVTANSTTPEFDPRDGLFAGGYNTRLNEMFRNQTPPHDVVRLNDSLQQMRTLMDARAIAVVANEDAFEAMTRAGISGSGGASNVVLQFERMRDARLAFLSRTRDYNFLIAQYALRVGGPSVSTTNVLSMLIGTPREGRTILFGDSAVQTASATSAGSPRSSRIPTQIAPDQRQDRSILLEPTQTLQPTPGQPIFLGP